MYVHYEATQDPALPRKIGMRYCRLHVPRYHRQLRVAIGARWVCTRRDLVIMQTRYLQLGDLFERPASKAAVCGRVLLLGLGWLDGRSCASGSCGRETRRLFWAARVC